MTDAPPIGQFGLILADPPWRFATFDGKSAVPTQAADPYDTMTLDDIKGLPLAFTGAADCVCVMWATAPLLPEAIDVLKAWGFTYKTAGSWAKQSSTGKKWAFGTGYVFRSAAEFYVVGMRGAPRIKSRSVRNLIVAPVREHSRKPDDMHENCEKLFDGPYLELFARESRSGWVTWGNQATKFDTTGEAAA